MPETQNESFSEELAWFKRILNYRMLQGFDREQWTEKLKFLPDDEAKLLAEAKSMTDINPPEPCAVKSGYYWIVTTYALDGWERLLLLLALIPHVQPELLEPFSTEKNPEYGGIKGINHKGFLPTGQTALFLIGENDNKLQRALLEMLGDQHKFHKANILSLERAPNGEPELSGALVPSREIVDIVIRGFVRPPDFGNDFPAKRITTGMSWDDLVLSPITQRQVEEVKIWTRNGEKLMSEFGMAKRMKPGYKILFHGSSGTGKTLTACLLGQYLEKHVFRIDLSMIVSKYIGETEKNLAKVFDKAEHADWILFFDEADALFGSRTRVSNSHDRYANQEVSYLLQRIEDYNGIVILASNMKGNIDDAFMRRFSSVVHFPFPKSEERLLLWKKAIPDKLRLSADVDMKKLADRYEMTGANITNIIAWCALMALEKNDMEVTDGMLREGMSRELAKEGRTL
jgi:hypothetical protein